MANLALLIFVKDPEAGNVKTRLAADLGAERAARVYRGLAEAVIRPLVPLAEEGIELTVCYAPSGSEAAVRRWLGPDLRYEAQWGESLSERLEYATSSAFARGASRAVVIGSDCPEVDADTVLRAFRALDEREVVLGPAADGGYYLLGLSRPVPWLFRGMPWSTPSLFGATVDRLRAEGVHAAFLEEKRDVDRVGDLEHAGA